MRGLISLAVLLCAGQAHAIVDGAPSDDAAVVPINTRGASCSDRRVTQCSGVMIAPATALTAAHCVERAADSYLVADVPVDAIVLNDTADLALVHLARELGDSKPISDAVIQADDEVRIVGFGFSAAGADDAGTQRQGVATITSIEAESFDIAPAPSMSCIADSGGPVLLDDAIVGITSTGDPQCASYAHNVRVSAHEGFVQSESHTPSGADPCANDGDSGCTLSTGRSLSHTPWLFVALIFSAWVCRQRFVDSVWRCCAALRWSSRS